MWFAPASSTVLVVVAMYPQRSGERKVARFSSSQANISAVKWRSSFRLSWVFHCCAASEAAIHMKGKKVDGLTLACRRALNHQLFYPFFVFTFPTSGLAGQIPIKTDQARHWSATFLAATSMKEDCQPHLIGLDRSCLAKPAFEMWEKGKKW